MMSHQVLDAKEDIDIISTFILGTDVNICDITIGSQIYYLFKEEEDEETYSFYFGVVAQIDSNNNNTPNMMIRFDDEELWIDLFNPSERNDWRLIPNDNPYFDNNLHSLSKQQPQNKQKKKRKQKNEKADFEKVRFCVGNQGFVQIAPKLKISCTVSHGPKFFDAVLLQSCSPTNVYQFWVRKEDILQILENEKLIGQRVGFELNGQTSRYKVIEIDKKKEFVRCYFKQNINQTWIEINNFHTSLPSISVSISPSLSSKNGVLQGQQKQQKRARGRPKKSKSKIREKSLKLSSLRKQQQKSTKTTTKNNEENGDELQQVRVSDLMRYQNLQRFGSYHYPYYHHSLVRPGPPSYMNPVYVAISQQPSYVNLHCYANNGNNAFYDNAYPAQQQIIGQKRPRSNDELPPNKRRRLLHDANQKMQLIAPQPPQPNVEMPELIQSESATPTKSKNENEKTGLMPCDDVRRRNKNEQIQSIGINVECDTQSEKNAVCSQFVCRKTSRVRRPNLSAPPPKRNEGRKEGNGENLRNILDMNLTQITDKLTDENVSNKERIDGLKCVVKYLTNCQQKINECMGKIGRCVEIIIDDLQKQKHHQDVR